MNNEHAQCAFCENLRIQYMTDAAFRGKHPQIYHEYEAARISVIYAQPRKRIGQITSGGYKLRFCPECGANIKKRLRKWKAGLPANQAETAAEQGEQ